MEAGTSLVVQRLRIHPSMQQTRVRSLAEEVRSHIPQSNYTLAATRESVRGTENVLSATTKTNAAKRRNKSQQKSQLKLLSLSLRGDQVFVPLKKGKKKHEIWRQWFTRHLIRCTPCEWRYFAIHPSAPQNTECASTMLPKSLCVSGIMFYL